MKELTMLAIMLVPLVVGCGLLWLAKLQLAKAAEPDELGKFMSVMWTELPHALMDWLLYSIGINRGSLASRPRMMKFMLGVSLAGLGIVLIVADLLACVLKIGGHF